VAFTDLHSSEGKQRAGVSSKPNSVPRGDHSPRGGDHSSGPPIAERLKRPTREVLADHHFQAREGDLRGEMFPRRSPTSHLNPPLFGLAPGGVYRATPVTRGTGELLPHLFTLTSHRSVGGGFLSVALSFGSPRVAVSDHPALWSSDFPPLRGTGGATTLLTSPSFSFDHQWPRWPNGRPCCFPPS
jgi:hypothetical protein